jgi:hypothetical protein
MMRTAAEQITKHLMPLSRRRSQTAGKACFDDLYNNPDAAPYMREMASHHYVISDATSAINRSAIQTLNTPERRQSLRKEFKEFNVIELCAGYGLSMQSTLTTRSCKEIFEHYNKPRATNTVAIHADNQFIAQAWRKDKVFETLTVTGVDISQNAVSYGERVGIFDRTISRNLEEDSLDGHEQNIVKKADLVVATGAFSYITTKTLDQLFSAVDRDDYPVFLFFPLVNTPMVKFRDFFKAKGMNVYWDQERHWLPQRKFESSSEEYSHSEVLRQMNVTKPAIETADTYLHAVPFVGYPKSIDVAEVKSWLPHH